MARWNRRESTATAGREGSRGPSGLAAGRDRVDGILATAEGVTSSVGGMVNTVSATISSPLVKLSAFAYGLRKAAGAAGSDDKPSRGRRRRRR